MELWIRSQKKPFLVKVDNVAIDCDGYSLFTYANIDCNDITYELGTYKTKERALEVLDEIQRLITDLQYMSYAIPNDKFAGYRPNVYEMPKE